MIRKPGKMRTACRTRRLVLAALAICAWAGSVPVELPDWVFGPFIRPANARPVIAPDTNAVFDCPMRGRPVHWEALHTFNPAAVVRNDQVWLLYRAEDDTGSMAIGQHTSRLGLAISRDGLHFRRRPTPVLYPADDAQKTNEWDGGCEDPRLVEAPNGGYVLLYTQWNRKTARLAVATSPDIIHWTKHGPVFADDNGWSKSGSIVCRISGNRLQAAKVNGKYWMYWGDSSVRCAWSDDLIHWTSGPVVLKPRPGRFDSVLVEAGPPAVLTTNGIVLLYNGMNRAHGGDAALPADTYAAGQALFDAQDPARLLARLDEPFFKPELPFEQTGQYKSGTTFVEGLVWFHRQWFLYYGCADSFVGVAVWPPDNVSENPRAGIQSAEQRLPH